MIYVVEIGMADATPSHAYPELTGSRLGGRDVLDRDRTVGTME